MLFFVRSTSVVAITSTTTATFLTTLAIAKIMPPDPPGYVTRRCCDMGDYSNCSTLATKQSAGGTK